MRARHIVAVGLLALIGSAALAQSMHLPARRGGQWRVTVSGMGRGPGSMTMAMCVDPATERSFSPYQGSFARGAGEEQACSKRESHPIPGGWSFQSVCPDRQGGMRTTSGVVTGDFQSHIHMVVDNTDSRGAHHMVMDQIWLGPCKPGGGQTITLPDGRTITIPTH